ncbi:MAG: hypothetical protein IJ097_03480 [Bacilli bacterium]|nr:hypothetical protein [Bacilli bacterium]
MENQEQVYNKQKKGKDKKTIVLMVLLLLLVTVTIGYAILSTTIKINGSSTIQPIAKWCIGPKCAIEGQDECTDISSCSNPPVECPANEKCTILDCDANPNSCDNIPDPEYCEDQNNCDTGSVIWMEGDTIYFKHILAKPGDTFIFYVKYNNGGNIDAKVKDVAKSALNATAQRFMTYDVTYNDGSTISQNDILAAGETAIFKVTVTYKSTITTLPTDAEIALINEIEDGHTGATSLFTVNYEQK